MTITDEMWLKYLSKELRLYFSKECCCHIYITLANILTKYTMLVFFPFPLMKKSRYLKSICKNAMIVLFTPLIRCLIYRSAGLNQIFMSNHVIASLIFMLEYFEQLFIICELPTFMSNFGSKCFVNYFYYPIKSECMKTIRIWTRNGKDQKVEEVKIEIDSCCVV